VIRYEKRNMPPLPTHMDTQKKRNTSQMPQMPKTIPRNKKMSKKLTDEEIKKLPKKRRQAILKQRKRLKEHPEKCREASRRCHHKFKQERNETRKKLYQAHHEDELKYRRQYYQNHKDECNKRNNEWNLKNRDYLLMTKKEYYQKNKDIWIQRYNDPTRRTKTMFRRNKLTDEELQKLPEQQRKNILRQREYHNRLENRTKNKTRCGNTYYEKNRNEERLKRQKEIKKECFQHYAKDQIKCEICGITNIDVLCIDHINGNGNIERKKYCGNPREGGTPFYFKLKRMNYPDGYRLLCLNCNHIEAIKKGFCSSILREKNKEREEKI